MRSLESFHIPDRLIRHHEDSIITRSGKFWPTEGSIAMVS